MRSFQPFGDSALLINFEQKIDPEINQKVVQLYKSILSAQIPGVTFCSPAYCSVTVGYNFDEITYDGLCQNIEALEITNVPVNQTTILEIPVCYEGDYAPDMEELCLQTGLTTQEIISLHTSPTYQVYMIGFLPGFAYMGTLSERLKCNRKETPRLRVPASSVGLAGLQTGIYPSEAPGGWQIIGRIPWRIFDPKAQFPCRFQAGDKVTFHSIGESEFHKLERSTDSDRL